MLRTIVAGIIGAVAAIVVAFVIVAVLSAIRGVPVLYEPTRAEYGWEGAQDGMLRFIAIGIMMIWPFPAIAVAGAAIGIFTRMVIQKRTR
jgi:hypothetical protein